MDYKKILDNKFVKVAAIIVLPTALVGTYYAYKYIKNKKSQKKTEDLGTEEKKADKKMNFIQKLFR